MFACYLLLQCVDVYRNNYRLERVYHAAREVQLLTDGQVRGEVDSRVYREKGENAISGKGEEAVDACEAQDFDHGWRHVAEHKLDAVLGTGAFKPHQHAQTR